MELESDCQIIIRKLLSRVEDFSPTRHIFDTIWNCFGQDFLTKISFVKCHCNVPTHILAQYSLSIDEPQVWIGVNPLIVATAVLADINTYSFLSLKKKKKKS